MTRPVATYWGTKSVLSLRSLISRWKTTGVQQSGATSGDIECCLKEQNRKGAYRPSTLPDVEPLSILESNRIV